MIRRKSVHEEAVVTCGNALRLSYRPMSTAGRVALPFIRDAG